MGPKAPTQVENGNFRLSTRFLEHLLSPAIQNKVTHPAVFTPNLAYKNFSPKSIMKVGVFEQESPVLLASQHPKMKLGRGDGKEMADLHTDWMEKRGPEKGNAGEMPRVLNLNQLGSKVAFRETEQKARLGVEESRSEVLIYMLQSVVPSHLFHSY